MGKPRKATRNMLGAIRDLSALRSWIQDGEPCPTSELMGAVSAVDKAVAVWEDSGFPDAPESVELEGK